MDRLSATSCPIRLGTAGWASSSDNGSLDGLLLQPHHQHQVATRVAGRTPPGPRCEQRWSRHGRPRCQSAVGPSALHPCRRRPSRPWLRAPGGKTQPGRRNWPEPDPGSGEAPRGPSRSRRRARDSTPGKANRIRAVNLYPSQPIYPFHADMMTPGQHQQAESPCVTPPQLTRLLISSLAGIVPPIAPGSGRDPCWIALTLRDSQPIYEGLPCFKAAHLASGERTGVCVRTDVASVGARARAMRLWGGSRGSKSVVDRNADRNRRRFTRVQVNTQVA